MRRHRFHLAELEVGERTVSGDEVQHLQQVLRVGVGDELRAFDGRGFEATAVVTDSQPGRLTVRLGAPRASDVEADLRVTVAVALLKGDKLSEVVRRCTELGATAFRPLLTKRADVPALSPNKLDRLRRVAREAAKQCGRAVVPEIYEAVPLAELDWRGGAVLAHPGASRPLARAAGVQGEDLTVITGPEGGFSGSEVEDLVGRGATGVTLGRRVLRAETAPTAIVAALLVPEAR